MPYSSLYEKLSKNNDSYVLAHIADIGSLVHVPSTDLGLCTPGDNMQWIGLKYITSENYENKMFILFESGDTVCFK